jgi:hypothetical protein
MPRSTVCSGRFEYRRAPAGRRAAEAQQARHGCRALNGRTAPDRSAAAGSRRGRGPASALAAAWLALWGCSLAQGADTDSRWAEIQVVDADTGRGVPLAELETVHGLRFVTDNAGRIALCEPALMDRLVFFHVRSHGYQVPKDGFGYAGVRLTPRPGEPCIVRLRRVNVAERVGRLTGEGLFRDSRLLGYDVPAPNPDPRGGVVGQDSTQAAVYRGRVYWFWGDTLRLEYPLGLFRAAGATTPLEALRDRGDAPEPLAAIDYEYFVGTDGFARAMMPLAERPEGVIWLDGVCTVDDAHSAQRLIAHYSRRKGLAEQLEHGIAVFNDQTACFEPVRTLPLEESWRHPRGHATVYEVDGRRWLLFGNPEPVVRVPATLQAVLDPGQYEAYTCAAEAEPPAPASPGGQAPAREAVPLRDEQGALAWRWQKHLPPTDSRQEHRWLRDGQLRAEEARFCPADSAAPQQRVVLHSGSVRWNAYRQRWIMIAGQAGGGPSLLGEVWYAEARQPCGPFRTAVKIVTHDRMSFYNVVHHPFLDRAGGRYIHFEGTYTREFSGNPDRTPRYDYNQILYRLDLDAPALRPSRVE